MKCVITGRISATLVLFSVLGFGPTAFGHGSDKPGPNKGFLQMAGAMHTEVVPLTKNSFKVFLLDISFANPVIERSSVTAKIIRPGKSGSDMSGSYVSEANCKPVNQAFVCTLPKGMELTKGVLQLVSSRADGPGLTTQYELPLKLSGMGH